MWADSREKQKRYLFLRRWHRPPLLRRAARGRHALDDGRHRYRVVRVEQPSNPRGFGRAWVELVER
jgi:hypothetical protein